MSATDAPSRTAPGYFEEPASSKWLFASTKAAWMWLILHLWLGWEWFQSGWSKVVGGPRGNTLTSRSVGTSTSWDARQTTWIGRPDKTPTAT